MPPVPLRPLSVRFAEDAHELVRRAAQEAGVSITQFIREAAVMRAAGLVQYQPELDPEGKRLARGRD